MVRRGKGGGFGFVTLDSNVAGQAVEEAGKEALKGRTLVVRPDDKRGGSKYTHKHTHIHWVAGRPP